MIKKVSTKPTGTFRNLLPFLEIAYKKNSLRKYKRNVIFKLKKSLYLQCLTGIERVRQIHYWLGTLPKCFENVGQRLLFTNISII